MRKPFSHARRESKLGVCALALLATIGLAARSAALEAKQSAQTVAQWLFPRGQASANVHEGPLFGRGQESIEHRPDGGLHIVRTREYLRARDPESSRVVDLPEPWRVRSTLEVSAKLRLLRADTTLWFHRSLDRALGRNASDDDFAPFFEWDRMVVSSDAAGNELHALTTRGKRTVTSERYAYPGNGVPLEIVGLVMSLAVAQHRNEFELELLLPDGSEHGVSARVHRVRDATPFGAGYEIPARSLQRDGRELAVVDLWLTSPFKRLLFPHHFYFMYEAARPSDLLAIWGGDPDENLQAFRNP
jgi:hypothetical protein